MRYRCMSRLTRPALHFSGRYSIQFLVHINLQATEKTGEAKLASYCFLPQSLDKPFSSMTNRLTVRPCKLVDTERVAGYVFCNGAAFQKKPAKDEKGLL